MEHEMSDGQKRIIENLDRMGSKIEQIIDKTLKQSEKQKSALIKNDRTQMIIDQMIRDLPGDDDMMMLVSK